MQPTTWPCWTFSVQSRGWSWSCRSRECGWMTAAASCIGIGTQPIRIRIGRTSTGCLLLHRRGAASWCYSGNSQGGTCCRRQWQCRSAHWWHRCQCDQTSTCSRSATTGSSRCATAARLPGLAGFFGGRRGQGDSPHHAEQGQDHVAVPASGVAHLILCLSRCIGGETQSSPTFYLAMSKADSMRQ